MAIPIKNKYFEKGNENFLFDVFSEIKFMPVAQSIIPEVEEADKEIDGKYIRYVDRSWDFAGEETKSFTHGFHTYPAMFIPQVARRLLETYSCKYDTVCDIFCGSGTTLVESKVLSRYAYGIDLNPFAIFLARVKTTILDPKLLAENYYLLLRRIERLKDDQVEIPNFPNLYFWFKKNVIFNLAKIKKAILEISDESIRNFFLVAFSETVRNCSNAKSGEFKLVRIEQEKLERYNPDPLDFFRIKTETNLTGMQHFYHRADHKIWTRIIYGDSSKDNNIPPNSIDCIVTSPPYGDSRTTVAYGQFSRLSLQWLDMLADGQEPFNLDSKLLGGKPAKVIQNILPSSYLSKIIKEIATRDQKRAKDVLSFYIDLTECLKNAYRILKPSKYMCIVIGNRKVKQIRIPTDYIIAEIAESLGFQCKEIIVRNIPSKRMPLRNSPTNQIGRTEETMNKESIVILQKVK